MTKQNEKRILYLRTDVGTQDLIGGGSVAHTLGVLKGFMHLGAYIVCASTAMHVLLEKMPFTFVPLAMPGILSACGFKLNCLLSNVIFYFKLRRRIREHHINLIYQRYSMLNCVGVALAHRCKIPLYLEFNGSESWVDKHWSPKRRLKINWLIDSIELLNLKHAAKIIVVSQVLKEQLLARGIDAYKICVCPNGVDPDMFDPTTMQSERAGLRAHLGLQEKCVFGFSGTFGPWHGVEVLAYVIPLVARQNARVHFMLIGDGALRQMLYDALAQAQVLHCVTFTGMIHGDKVPAYLAACDAFLCPTQKNPDGSRFFGSPTKLFEYMMTGKPIIASDIEQIGDILRHDAGSLLVCPEDYTGFVNAVLHVLAMTDAERALLGNALKICVRSRYTWYAHVCSFINNEVV